MVYFEVWVLGCHIHGPSMPNVVLGNSVEYRKALGVLPSSPPLAGTALHGEVGQPVSSVETQLGSNSAVTFM